MEPREILKELNLPYFGEEGKDGAYTVDLESSSAFGKAYSILESRDDLDYMGSYSLLTVDNGSLIYRFKDNYQIALIADFKNDLYKLVVEQL